MTIKRINEFPEGSGSLSNDDVFLFMDDPSGSGITKRISLSQISSAIGGGGGGGNPFDQDLNTTNTPTFVGVNLSNGTTLAQGTFDNSTGGQSGISLNCYVGYELNWQGGHLKSSPDGGATAANIWCDSPIEFQGTGIDNMEINNGGLTFPDGTTQNSANIPSSSITDFDVAVSGLLPVKDIVAGTGITVSNSSGVYTINHNINSVYKKFGSFYDTTTQTNVSTTGVNTMSYNTTAISSGVSITSGNMITFDHTGFYNIQFSAQIEKTDGGDDRIDIWLSRTGVYEEWTNTTITLHQQDAKTVAAWNFIVPVNSGDYYQLHWSSTDIDMKLMAQSGLTSPIRPDIPSIILTAIEL